MLRCPNCRGAITEADSTCPACHARLSTAPPAPDPDLLGGNWKLVRLLGTGGMGAVWLAEDVALQRFVAIKLLAEKLCHDPELIERFLREARLMAKVDHPNVVPVYFVGRAAHVPFIVMKMLSGQPLSEHVKARRLTVAEICDIAGQVCAGLQCLHEFGIVHRDVKPANIFVCDGGRVCLLDLGVAREDDSSMTQSGALIGTPRYMAPEQIHGGRAGPSADLYSLGAVLYELISGRPMFDVSSPDSVLRAHVYAKPERLADVPESLWKVIERALEKDPAKRFQTAVELAKALEFAAKDAPAQALPEPSGGVGEASPSFALGATTPSMPRTVQRARRWWVAVAAVVLVLGTGVTAARLSGSFGAHDEDKVVAEDKVVVAVPALLPPKPELAAASAAPDAGNRPSARVARPPKPLPPEETFQLKE